MGDWSVTIAIYNRLYFYVQIYMGADILVHRTPVEILYHWQLLIWWNSGSCGDTLKLRIADQLVHWVPEVIYYR